MEIRENLLYTKTHEWILRKNSIVRVGITDYAQDKLTDVVYVELPEIGKYFKRGEVVATLESVKSVSEVYAPVSGKIFSINDALNDDPGLINREPYDSGWIFEIEMENEEELKDLINPKDYEKILEGEK
ncbi:MAG: glycine cleavage system protein GcvH [Thermoplasmatales archaeon]|nr:glycine cleavage system protein GcvH [Thermoplasmatales archaeon]